MKRKTLTTAVLAGLTGMAGMVSVSNAVNVNPDGLGQVLLYPYYSARGGNDTFVTIVNTTDRAKAVKIRFLEALNSQEVLDFNIYMSAFDVWAAAITEDGDTGGGRVVINDTTCTAPYLLEEADGSQEFLTTLFTDGGPTGADRTRSGYLEVIEMGEITAGTDAEAAATHDSDGVPPVSGAKDTRVCGLFQERWVEASKANGTGVWLDDATTDIDPPAGGLFGSGAVINVAEGTMFSYNATAIDGFWADGAIGHSDPGDLDPSLLDADVDSTVFINGDVSEETWNAGIDAVNAVLTLETLMNEYNVAAGVAGASEWVVTFPTKRFFVNNGEGGTADAPFTDNWDPETAPWSCDVMDLQVWDREEQTPGPDTGGVVVSPADDPEESVFELCREANVIRFANDGSLPEVSEIFKEPSPEVTAAPEYGYVNFDLPEAFEAGWARFDWSTFESRPATSGNKSIGLPGIGFWANTFTNGDLGGTLANYGGAHAHRGSRVFPQS